MSYGVVVLASGQSSRFGSNKLLAPFEGKPLLANLLSITPQTFQPRLVVTRTPAIAALARTYGWETLLHDAPDVSDTIRFGITRMAETDGSLFCVGDQPLLTRETMERILAMASAHPNAMVRVCAQGQEGNPVLFPRTCYEELSALCAGQTGSTVIRRHRERLCLVEVAPEELFDIDTPEDHARATAYVERRNTL